MLPEERSETLDGAAIVSFIFALGIALILDSVTNKIEIAVGAFLLCWLICVFFLGWLISKGENI